MHGDGKFTLLFVHGWCIDQSYWSNQVAAFNSNYKIVTIDLPGFGKSGTNRKRREHVEPEQTRNFEIAKLWQDVWNALAYRRSLFVGAGGSTVGPY